MGVRPGYPNRVINDTLAALIAKHEEVAAAYPNYDQIVDEKKAARIAAEDGLDKITVYIKTAFRADSGVLLNNLRIDRDFPTDDEKIMLYLMDFLSQYDDHDQITYPIPPAYNDSGPRTRARCVCSNPYSY